MYILGYPLGLIMRLLYNLLHSYGWSLILFTLLIKLVMVPLSISSRNLLLRLQQSSRRCRKSRRCTQRTSRR